MLNSKKSLTRNCHQLQSDFILAFLFRLTVIYLNQRSLDFFMKRIAKKKKLQDFLVRFSAITPASIVYREPTSSQLHFRKNLLFE